jgi:uncharacterized protein YrrD
MAAQPASLRHSDLLRKPVLSKGATQELGWVELLWMHPPAHRVLGFICRPTLLGAKRLAFNLNQIKHVGQATITVQSDPVETTVDQVKLLETLIGHELWNDEGQVIGRIVDCLFSRETGLISDYLFRTEGWRELVGNLYQLPTHQILNFDKRRVYVAADAAHWLNLYEEGVEAKVMEASDRLRENYTEATQVLSEQAREITQQARERLQKWSGSFKQHIQALTEQDTEATRSFIDDDTDFEPSAPSRKQDATPSSFLRQIKQQALNLKDELQSELEPLKERLVHPRPSAQSPSPQNEYRDRLPKGSTSDEWDDEEPWI